MSATPQNGNNAWYHKHGENTWLEGSWALPGGRQEGGLNIVVLLNTQVVKLPSKYLCLYR